MKLHPIFILCILISFPIENANAYDFEKDGIYYNIISASDKTVYVTYDDINNSQYSGNIVIPKTIIYNGIEFKIIDVDYQAFPFCKNIKSITLPKDLPNFGTINKIIIGVRGYNQQPWDLYVPDMETWLNLNVDIWAFPDQSRDGGSIYINGELLVDAIIPEGITKIRREAFFRYYKLKTIILPSSVKKIEYGAFMYCDNLECAELNDELSEIDSYAFYYCKNLNYINIPQNLSLFGTDEVYGDGYVFFECNNLKSSLYFPEGIKVIPMATFNDCYSLKEVELPSTIVNIKEKTFDNCVSLTLLKCNAIIPPVCETEFANVDKFNCKIVVPDESVQAYKNSSGWNKFFNIVGINDYISGISSIKRNEQNNEPSIYMIDGRKIEKLGKGINIVVLSDGTFKKVILK